LVYPKSFVFMADIKQKISGFEEELGQLRSILKVDAKKENVGDIQAKMAAQDFWQDQKEASRLMTELKAAKSDVDTWESLRERIKELKELLSMDDDAYQVELEKETLSLDADFGKLREAVLFSDKFDSSGAIVEINSGAGGTESCDWASMLYRMYYRWAEDKGFPIELLEEVRGEEAGLKNITFLIDGYRAYGMLKPESGVHRLVRISPFDANKRRHTSFASVGVIPDIKEDVDIEIKPEELKVDTFRSGGAGGQHVNKTESAIRITHIATGIVVSAQVERSQHQNRLFAMRVLKGKLYELKEQKKQKELDSISGEKRKIEWGSQIRSYVLHPYLLVKDHRTDYEDHDAWKVLDGHIDEFIMNVLKWMKGSG
jgi:peptide chain release factor 2